MQFSRKSKFLAKKNKQNLSKTVFILISKCNFYILFYQLKNEIYIYRDGSITLSKMSTFQKFPMNISEIFDEGDFDGMADAQ